MGCGSSREVRPVDGDLPPPPVTQSVRAHSAVAATSQTAFNAPLSTTTSRHQSTRFHAGASGSGSNISTQASSSGQRWQQQDLSLTEHYNVPLAPPKAWTSSDRTWTKTQLQRERQAFFETRVTGRPEIWAALKEVTELIRSHNVADAQIILDAAAITLPTGELSDGAYDERGQLYKIPTHIILDPANLSDDDDRDTVVGEFTLATKQLDADGLSEPKSIGGGTIENEKVDKGKDTVEKDAIKVKCRLSDRGGPDTIVLLGKSQPVSVLLKRLRSEAEIASGATVRIVYFGKILTETASLEDQGWQVGHVVQALVSNFGP